MAKLTLQDAESTAGKGRPWTIRLEYVGANPSNTSGQSAKYWYATGRGLAEKVEVGYGALGTAPQCSLIDLPTLSDRVAEKLAKGYVWANTPYIRMSVASLAKLAGTPVVQATQAKHVCSLFPVVRKKATVKPQKKLNLSMAFPPKTWAVPAKAPSVPTNDQIRTLCIIREGLVITGYSARDEHDNEVLVFNPKDGVEFAREQGLDICFSTGGVQ